MPFLLQNACLAHTSFCDLGVHGLHEREIDGLRSSVPLSSAVVCIESTPAYAGVAVRGYYFWCIWLSCRAVSAVVCIESIPAYAGVVVRGCHSLCMPGSLAGQFSHIKKFLISIILQVYDLT